MREGFWSPENQPTNDEPWHGQHDFLRKLAIVEAKSKVTQFRGWSNCRLCGRANGSREFSTSGAVWPEGFRHYVEAHNVKPSQEFIKFIDDNA